MLLTGFPGDLELSLGCEGVVVGGGGPIPGQSMVMVIPDSLKKTFFKRVLIALTFSPISGSLLTFTRSLRQETPSYAIFWCARASIFTSRRLSHRLVSNLFQKKTFVTFGF